jgi:hypothetical protein
LRKDARRRGAAILGGLACAGFVLAPLLHAETHRAEQRALRRAALARAFELAFACDRSASREELSRSLDLARGARSNHDHGKEPGHSHGPGKDHGSGSLAHFALAIHAAPAAPLTSVASPPRAFRPVAPESLHAIPRYLVVERSQAPPVS